MIHTQFPYSNPDEAARQLLLSMVQFVVEDHAAIEIDSYKDHGTTIFTVKVAPAETGKLIGKQGRTARSLRIVLSAAGMKSRRLYALEIHEEDLRT